MTDTSINNNILQYKFLFALPWILFYLIFPTWALPISVPARAAVFFGLIIYLSVSAYMMNQLLNSLTVSKPVIIMPTGIIAHIKNNSWLIIICCIAGMLHIYPLFFPILIMGDETQHLQAGLWMYEYVDVAWHGLFQIIFWILIVTGLSLIIFKRRDNAFVGKFQFGSGEKTGRKITVFFVVLLLFLSIIYFLLLRNITFYPQFVRYPHLIKLFYQTMYTAFGITHVGPRILQLVFYILGAVYLYRLIILFSSRESALLGATIYLFLPVMFAYANLAEIGCGAVFFIILICFHFLRFIKLEDNRDLLLASFFIGAGFLYKRDIFLMFFICTGYLIAVKIKNRDVNYKIHLKMMLLSLVPIIPWMIIGKFFTWRNYKIVLSNLMPFDGKVFSFFRYFPQDISWIIFILFLFSIIYISVFKRNVLTGLLAFLFIAYYFFLTLDLANYSPRLFMSLYPTVAVFLSESLYGTIGKIRWKHSFRTAFLILFVYLISICTVAPINAKFLSSIEFVKLQYFPGDDAMKWVKENVKDGEKILTMRIMSSNFYRVKYDIDKNRIVDFWYRIDDVSTPDKLKAFYRKHGLTYVMFPYSPAYMQGFRIFEYLKNNPEREFMEVAKFNIDNNYIYIYRLKDSTGGHHQ